MNLRRFPPSHTGHAGVAGVAGVAGHAGHAGHAGYAEPTGPPGARLLLLRHGATRSNERGRFQGWSNAGLSDAGVQAVRRTARWIAGRFAPERVWSSDLARCRQTARLLFPGAHLDLDPRLRELAFGTFEGRTDADLLESGDSAYRAWLQDPDACPPPGGEPLSALRARVLAWWKERAVPWEERMGAAGGTLVVVTHGGPAGILLGRLLDPRDPAAGLVPAPGGCLHLRTDGRSPPRWRLTEAFATSHRQS